MDNGEGGQNITPQYRRLRSSKTVSWSESVGFFLTREGFHKLNSRFKRFPLIELSRKKGINFFYKIESGRDILVFKYFKT